MDKYEYKLKLEQISESVRSRRLSDSSGDGRYHQLEKGPQQHIRCAWLSDIYEKTGKYDACREVLLQAYDHSPIGRNIVSQLAEVAYQGKTGLMRLRNITTSSLR